MSPRLTKGIWWATAILNTFGALLWAIVLHSLKCTLLYGGFAIFCLAMALNLFSLIPLDKKTH